KGWKNAGIGHFCLYSQNCTLSLCMNDSSLLCMQSCKCPVFGHACLGFILSTSMRKILLFLILEFFTHLEILCILLTRRSAIGNNFRTLFRTSGFRPSIFHSPRLSSNALRSINRVPEQHLLASSLVNIFPIMQKNKMKEKRDLS